MKVNRLRRVLYLRKAFQMTAITVIIVLVISIAVVVSSGSSENRTECPPVENLAVLENDTHLHITWYMPVPADLSCHQNIFGWNVTATETINDSGFSQDLYIEIPKDSCKLYVITISTVTVQLIAKANATIDHFSGIAGSGEVRDLRVGEYGLEWLQPDNSERCQLSYRVEVFSGSTIHAKELVEEPPHKLSLIPCSDHTVTVTTIVDGSDWVGRPSSIKVRGPTTRKAPYHVSTNPDFKGAYVTWTDYDEVNECEILAIEFTYFKRNGDGEVRTSNFSIRESELYRLDDLMQNTTYVYTCRWILETNDNVVSSPVTFLTTPLTNPAAIYSIAAEDGGAMIRWTQDYESEFVTRQEVIITNLGPQHFLPSRCPKGEIEYTFDVTGKSNYLNFTDARSNFNYTVMIVTHFEQLRLNTSHSTVITIPMIDPGPLKNITADYEYDNSVPYKVNSLVEWKIPCDINGPVKHFDVRISGTLNVPETDSGCSINFFAETMEGTGEEETYGFDTDILLPFFDYTFYITTVLDYEEERKNTEYMKLPPLPDAFTPPKVNT